MLDASLKPRCLLPYLARSAGRAWLSEVQGCSLRTSKMGRRARTFTIRCQCLLRFHLPQTVQSTETLSSNTLAKSSSFSLLTAQSLRSTQVRPLPGVRKQSEKKRRVRSLETNQAYKDSCDKNTITTIRASHQPPAPPKHSHAHTPKP